MSVMAREACPREGGERAIQLPRDVVLGGAGFTRRTGVTGCPAPRLRAGKLRGAWHRSDSLVSGQAL